MEFSRPEYWGGLPCPSPGDRPGPGIEIMYLCLLQWQSGSLPVALMEKPLSPRPCSEEQNLMNGGLDADTGHLYLYQARPACQELCAIRQFAQLILMRTDMLCPGFMLNLWR